MVRDLFPHPQKPPSELHFKDIRTGSKEFRAVDPAFREQLVNRFCELIMGMHESEIRLFSVIVDKTQWQSRNPQGTGQDLYNDAFEELSGRFDYFLRRRYAADRPSKGMIIADLQNSDASRALKGRHTHVQSAGTRYSSIRNIIETVLFLGSHESPGLQVADLCSYAMKRLIESNDDSLIRRIGYAFDREPMTSSVNPGKWHGIKYLGNDDVVMHRLNSIFPGKYEDTL